MTYISVLPSLLVQLSSPLRCEKQLFQHLASLKQPQVEVAPVQPHLQLERRRDEVDAVVQVVLQRPPSHPPDHAVALRLRPLKHKLIINLFLFQLIFN